MNNLILGLILTILPITELRLGLPLVLEYVLKNNLPVIPFFILVLTLNILMIFFIFWFFDNLHESFLKIKFYEKHFKKILNKIHKKSSKLEKRMSKFSWLALVLFVAIPLPGTGAWTGTTVAWVMNLDRKKSIMSIAIGVIIAGILILLPSLEILSLLS